MYMCVRVYARESISISHSWVCCARELATKRDGLRRNNRVLAYPSFQGIIGTGLLTKTGKGSHHWMQMIYSLILLVIILSSFERTSQNVENLFAAFIRLLPSGTREHQMLETEAAYYLYQPIEQLYLVMIATKTSNMVENFDCLRLQARIVQQCVCHHPTRSRTHFIWFLSRFQSISFFFPYSTGANTNRRIDQVRDV